MELKFLKLLKYVSLRACTPYSFAVCKVDVYGFSWYVNSRKSRQVLYMLALWEVEVVQAMVESSCKAG